MSEETENPFLSVIRVWAALAWADGIVQDSEREAITKLVSVAKLSEVDQKKAMSFLDEKIELEMDRVAGLSPAAGQGIYRAALRLAMVDLDMAAEEAEMLVRLREGLNIDEDSATEIEKSMLS